MTAPNLYEIFEARCSQYLQKPAFVYGNDSISFAQLQKQVDGWAQELESLNVTSGSRVVIAVEEPVAFIAFWLALWKLKCIPIPLEAGTKPDELKRAVAESQAHLVVLSGKDQVMIDGASAVLFNAYPDWRCLKIPDNLNCQLSDDLALFFYTSGTTGTPKCIMFSHDAMRENVLNLCKAIDLSEKDTVFTPISPVLPATLASAVLPALAVGATLALPKSPLPGVIISKLAKTEATVFFAVPYIYEMLVSVMELRKDNPWKNVRLCLTSSARLQAQLFDRFYELSRLPIRSIYCSSEAGACTYNNSDTLAVIRNSVGQVLEGVTVKIVAEGREVARGKSGEVYISGRHLSKGYFQRLELQEKVFGDGWVKTGDYGRSDQSGFLYLEGRISDTINVSGFLVNPLEVEEVLLKHPAVDEVVVYRNQDAILGEIVGARVVLKKAAVEVNDKDLMEFCVCHLSHYKVPRRIEIVTELPKSRYGKKVRNIADLAREAERMA
jgi:long-chain acyl-CoA synthetase